MANETETLNRVREYVKDMSPVFRAAILVSHDQQRYNQGWDEAMYQAQQDLMDILGEEQ